MRVEWLNDQGTRARIIRRGWRFWRPMEALVELRGKDARANPYNSWAHWVYQETGDMVEGIFVSDSYGWNGLQKFLHNRGYDHLERLTRAKTRRSARLSASRNWRPVRQQLPMARLLREVP